MRIDEIDKTWFGHVFDPEQVKEILNSLGFEVGDYRFLYVRRDNDGYYTKVYAGLGLPFSYKELICLI